MEECEKYCGYIRTIGELIRTDWHQELGDHDIQEQCVRGLQLVETSPLVRKIRNCSVYTKHPEESAKAREKGNKYFSDGRYQEALLWYNKAVLQAEFFSKSDAKSSELALSLANRAAVLIKLKQFSSAIQDLELCISEGYPRSSIYKIYQRLATAYEGAGEMSRCLLAIGQLIQHLQEDTPVLSKEAKKKLILEANARRKNLSQNSEVIGMKNSSNQEKLQVEREGLQVVNQHPEYPSLSAGVAVVEAEDRGRYAVAHRDLDVGQVISRERCLAAVPLLDKLLSHCWNCTKYTALAPLPCPYCPCVFCSVECSSTDFHRYECWMLRSNMFLQLTKKEIQELSRILLTLRIIVQQNLDFHYAAAANGADECSSKISGLENGATNQLQAYKTFNCLVKHLDSINQEEHLSTVIFLHCCLVGCGYLDSQGQQLSCQQLPNQQHHSQLLLNYLAAVGPNCHATFEQTPNSSGLSMLGLAIFPRVAATFNHSCDPNLFVVDMGQEQLTFTSRCVKEGEELNEVYYGHYGDTSLEKRRSHLQKQYHFLCSCSACRENYPNSDTLISEAKTFAETTPDKFLAAASDDDKALYDGENSTLREELEKAVADGNTDRYLQITKNRIRLACNHLRQPHILHLLGRLSIIKLMWREFGNRTQYKQDKLVTYY